MGRKVIKQSAQYHKMMLAEAKKKNGNKKFSNNSSDVKISLVKLVAENTKIGNQIDSMVKGFTAKDFSQIETLVAVGDTTVRSFLKACSNRTEDGLKERYLIALRFFHDFLTKQGICDEKQVLIFIYMKDVILSEDERVEFVLKLIEEPTPEG